MDEYFAQWDIDSDQWIQRLKSSFGKSSSQYLLKNPGDSLVADQIQCYPKAEMKFPSWHNLGFVYTKLSFEQSSGELAARFKSTLIKGSEVWDLTGGLGMDSIAFSNMANIVHHNEPNKALSRIAQHNHSVIDCRNIKYHNELAEDLVYKINQADTIYIDPSRRSENGRTFLLKDCVPDVTQMLPILKQKAKRVIIKLSPLYDINRIRYELPGTKQIHVVSVNSEVREILAVIDESLQESIHAVVLPEEFSITKSTPPISLDQTQTIIPTGNFLHVADPAIYKSDNVSDFASYFGLTYWGTGGYLFSETPVNIAAKSYEVIETLPFKPKELKKRLKRQRVNIHKRNFPIEVHVLYKQLSTSMGDDYHLFFTTLKNGDMAVCVTKPPVSS